MPKIIAVVCFTIFFLSSVARAGVADCRKDAEAIANRPDHRTVATAMFFDAEHPQGQKLALKHACALPSCQQLYFSMTEATVTAPAGFVPEPEFFGPGGAPKWRPLPRIAGSKCESLRIIKFRPIANLAGASSTAGSTGAAAGGASKDENKKAAGNDGKKSAAAQGESESLKAALEAFRESDARSLAPQATVGIAQGFPDIAAETVQILGQIVVDRASAEAYRLLKERLLRLLQCEPAARAADDATAVASTKTVAAWSPPAPTFPTTCKVLKPLRLQDVAISRDVLFGAVGADAVAYLQKVQASLPEDMKTAEKIGVAAVITSVVVPIIVRPRILVDVEPARVVVGAVLAHVKTLDEANMTSAETALAAGVLAYVKCVKEAADSKTPLVNCDFTTYADQYAGDNVSVRIASHGVAAQLVSVATLSTTDGRVDVRQRLIHAVDMLFASACMIAEGQDDPQFRCPAPPMTLSTNSLSALDALSILQPIVDAALDGDSNALVVAIAHPLELLAADQYQKNHKSAFLVLGSLLQYSATYAQQDSTNPQQMHDQRTKILESLTKDMTDRTARDSDDIWSFGGSLRLTGGVRIGDGGAAVLGPLGLPLGIGFDHVAAGRAAGIHLEFSPIDIGQYVSYDKHGVVKTPELADAFAPSVTIGAGWGKSIPLIVGGTFGYSPTFTTSPASSTRGTFNAGAIVGMYVPFIDLN